MTSTPLTTCLWFDGQAEEAVDFYLSVFKDSSRGRVGRYSEAGPGVAGSVLTAEFTVNGQQFVALNGGPQFHFDEAISFQIHCADQAEVDYYWSALLEGGGEEGPCGWLKDRFGLSWQVVPDEFIEMISGSDQRKAARATEKMMTMKKLDIAELRRGYEGS
jgi:predicted 3-demethylubiquinone-9 3-methyltransferase (glyoxalase superfamily)